MGNSDHLERAGLLSYVEPLDEITEFDEGNKKHQPGEIAKGGMGLAYPDFLRRVMFNVVDGLKELGGNVITMEGRMDISDALEHDFLKDSAISDERCGEILHGIIGGREGRKDRTEKLLNEINALKPDGLKEDANGVQTWMTNRRKAVVEACSKSYSQENERNQIFLI